MTSKLFPSLSLILSSSNIQTYLKLNVHIPRIDLFKSEIVREEPPSLS